MKTGSKAAALAVLFILLIVIASVNPVVSHVARKKLIDALARSCPKCSLEIAELKISVFTGDFAAAGIRYRGDPGADTTYQASAERVRIRFSPLSLLRKKPVLREIEADHPRVLIHEIQGRPSSQRPDYPPPGYAFRALPPARIGGIRIHDGTFVYESERNGHTGRITVSHIDGTLDSFATREPLLTQKERHLIHMDARGQLEDSGQVELHVRFDPYAEINHDSIRLEVTGLKMDELNRLFASESGLTFKGFMKLAKADLSLSTGQLSGTLTGEYKDLELKFHTTEDRGKISTALQNLIGSAKMTKNQPKKEEHVSRQREPKEPITHLLIQGLKDAAEKLISS